MENVTVDSGSVQLVVHNDDDTPTEFVRWLAHAVFGVSEPDAVLFSTAVEQHDRAYLGPFSPKHADSLLATALDRIREAGWNLKITSETASQKTASRRPVQFEWACDALAWHFAGIHWNSLQSTIRQIPAHMRADIQVALDRLFASPVGFFGLDDDQYETLSFARLTRGGRDAQSLAPAQYLEIDVGEGAPVRCLRNGLWLCQIGKLHYAVVLSFYREYGGSPMIRVELAVPQGADGEALVQRCFAELEKAVQAARSYRGKIISLDGDGDYRGRMRGIQVHRLPSVRREEVILPEPTLRLLDRNVLSFVESRDSLRRLGQSTRKGILLYGPPGTGKTHTIRYLATNLREHTTLIITAEQVALIGVYMSLARLLQPALIIIEDVDLIASDRAQMGACEESLLNKLLNEMDGLKEDADILFLLTTNRPQALESALAGRPGRIDQAIEVPLPDEIGRAKLVQLYGRGLPLDGDVVDEAVRRTEGVSAAFIKELMRRIAQSAIARDAGQSVIAADIDEALDDMLFSGGRLNVKLLGGAQEMARGEL
jgi:ATP-dependent Clp protease adapter protein ClpS